MSKTYIIAGNKTQFDMFIGKLPISEHPQQYQYVSGPDSVRGIRDPHGLFIGTWSKRPDIADIVTNLIVASSTKNHQLYEILEKVKKPHGLTLSDIIISMSGIILHPNDDGVHMSIVNGDTLVLIFTQAPAPGHVIEVKSMLGTLIQIMTNGFNTHFSLPIPLH